MYPSKVQYKHAVLNEMFQQKMNETFSYSPILDGNEPILSSGGNAIVFKIKDKNNKNYAFKFFNEELFGRNKRLNAISNFLENHKNETLIDFKYIDNLISVNLEGDIGSDLLYPGVIMKWIEADSLEEKLKYFIKEKDTNSLSAIAENFKKLALGLLNLEIAHGDLKLSNILIDKSLNLKLIDYDGLFVPELSGEKALENGTPSYQHLNRSLENYDKNLDHFSILSIYTSLLALSKSPNLFDKYCDGDNIIFVENDYKDPSKSAVFEDISKINEVKKYAYFLKKSCKSSTIDIPNIDNLIKGIFPKPIINISNSPEINLVGNKVSVNWSTENCTFVRINGKQQNGISGTKELKLEENNNLFFEFGNEIETLNTTFQIKCNPRPEILFFNAEHSDVKFDEEIELRWSVKYFSKIFIKYENSEVDVSGLQTIKIKNPGKSTTFKLVVLALSTNYTLEKKVELKVYFPIELNVKVDKKVTFPHKPVNIQLSAKNAQRITLLPEGRDITHKKTIQVRTDTFLEFLIKAENACYQSIFKGEISTVPIHKFDKKLVQLPAINISLPTPQFQKLNFEKRYESNFEKVVIETGKYLDYISPFLWYNQLATTIKNFKKISLNTPFIHSQNDDTETK